MSAGAAIWSDAAIAAAVFAVDPVGTGGVCLRASAGPVRDLWLACLRSLLPPSGAVRRLPPSVSVDRLLGGIDLPATLLERRPVVAPGLLADVDGGVLLVTMAERLSSSTAAHLNAVLDARELVVERDGLSRRIPSAFGVVAFDEGCDDERPPVGLCDRLACHLDLHSVCRADTAPAALGADDIVAARLRLPRVRIATEMMEALCHAAVSLGIPSLRAPLLAARVARARAALDDNETVEQSHVAFAARLVLAPRATSLPAAGEAEPPPQQEPPLQQNGDEAESRGDNDVPLKDIPLEDVPLEDVLVEAARAAIPPDLLQQLQGGTAMPRSRATSTGRQGAERTGPQRGRPIGARRGEFRSGVRLDILETLRTAALWQKLRHAQAAAGRDDDSRLLIRKQDFRITRFKQRSATSTIFVVDASGSTALQRLAEVKGAVQLLLADCYARRDEVALIAFRGQAAELVLPPTRSLTRARRSLAALPGGGGTPLPAAIISATTLAVAERDKGRLPTIVLITDGRANVSRNGAAGRVVAEAETHDAARRLRATGIPAVVVDSSPRPRPEAETIAARMCARYVPLPYANAAQLSHVVQASMGR